MRPRIHLASVFAACGALLSAVTAHSAAPLPVEDVLRAPTLASYSPASFSPDNRLLAYVVVDNSRGQDAEDAAQIMQSGVAWFGLDADVWVTDLESGEHRNITRARGHNWNASWSPDGQSLVFMADRSGGEQLGPARLWAWRRTSGELHQVSDADVRESFSPLQWARDGQSVLVSLFPEALGRNGWAARIAAKSPQPATAAKRGPQVFEFDPAASAAAPVVDQVNLDLWMRDLALVDVTTGRSERLTRNLRIGDFLVSPDRRRVVYSVLREAETPGGGQYLYDIVVREFGAKTERVLASRVKLPLMGRPFAWAPASDRVAWRTGGASAADELYVASVRRGQPQRIARNSPVQELRAQIEMDALTWDASGRHVMFVRDGAIWRAPADASAPAHVFARSAGHELDLVGARAHRPFAPGSSGSMLVSSMNPTTKDAGFARVDLATGAVTHVLQEAKRYGGYGTEPSVSPDGSRVAYVAEDPLDPPNLHVFDGHGAPRKVTEVAPSLTGRVLGKATVLEWRSLDGDLQRGALVYPADHRPGTRYPLIVKVYGGSTISDDLNRFGYASSAVENLQLYATRGYALLLADSKLDVGTPMVDLMKSVMPGIDAAIAAGVADPERIGVTGHSYGGYSSLALIVQSPRFRAAVMRAGMGNLIGSYGQLAADGSNYGLNWAESGQGRMGGHPWEYRERYIENSPSFYLDRVRTPLLIIHGDLDDAVPVYLADEIFTGLRRLGKTVAYARYSGENHWEGGWSYADQLDVLNRQIAWFDKHLKPASASVAGSR